MLGQIILKKGNRLLHSRVISCWINALLALQQVSPLQVQ